MKKEMDGRGHCVRSGRLRDSHLGRIQPGKGSGGMPTREREEEAGGRTENPGTVMQI